MAIPAAPTDDAGADAASEPPDFLPREAGADRFNVFTATCATETVDLSRTPPQLVLVVDGSAASLDGGASVEWSAVRGAISDFLGAMISDGGSPLAVGLIAFGDSQDSAGGNYPAPLDVPIKVVDDAQRAAVAARLAGSPSAASADASAALSAAYKWLAAQANGWNPSVVFMSRSDRGATSTNEQASWSAVALAQGGKTSPPVRTFAIGVGSGSDSFLHGIAKRGDACSTKSQCALAVDPTGKSEEALRAELLLSLSAAGRRATGCVFHTGPRAPDAGAWPHEALNLVVHDRDGGQRLIPIDDTDGWLPWPIAWKRMPEATILHGHACADNERSASAILVKGCPSYD